MYNFLGKDNTPFHSMIFLVLHTTCWLTDIHHWIKWLIYLAISSNPWWRCTTSKAKRTSLPQRDIPCFISHMHADGYFSVIQVTELFSKCWIPSLTVEYPGGDVHIPEQREHPLSKRDIPCFIYHMSTDRYSSLNQMVGLFNNCWKPWWRCTRSKAKRMSPFKTWYSLIYIPCVCWWIFISESSDWIIQ